MDIEEFKEFCSSFEGVTEEFPNDDNTIVYKVMGEVFALTDVDKFETINLKCDPVKAATLRDLYPEVKPGNYKDKRHWNNVDPHGYLSDVLIKEWIKDSYDLVVESLPRKDQRKVEKMIEKRKKKEKKEKEKQKNSEEE
ncbi:MmcQ/YjbR family DNA-binding protein [Balneolaceae bacterium YR4-1]|uniref:MmcQ/YjbR family DNA-binding protein n=1 Tax=Halalkalibaculum roseum TaxID=2709311 RepID=A0A6M1SZW2_9BACT|nr:MmcQ/YjbR family DNA-binding protein [Halalkalibaculum roseum]NGP75395.1 MmcQ/YjbR family DNA-binding protein [Halalkalibaculum roseum]